MEIKVVTIVGANGIMGSTAAGIFASFGNAKVYMVCRDYKKACQAVDRAVASVRAECIRERLIPKTFDEIEQCIQDSQWVFESTMESYEIKHKINKIIDKYRKPGTIVSTGTSGLSINELKQDFKEEGRNLYFGTHFFNPPYSLPLCELISSENNKEDIKEIYVYLEKVLKRKVVKTEDKPAFLANRVGFQFLNSALQEADKYQDKGGIDYIDAIFGGFTGRGMGPLNTIDFVGLDIHKAIVDNIYTNTEGFLHHNFILPEFCKELIENGKIGRKVKQGLFKLEIDEIGNKTKLVYDIKSKSYRKVVKYSFKYADKMIECIKDGKYEYAIGILMKDDSLEAKICRNLLIKYIFYSLIVVDEVGDSVLDIEIAMVYGFNWISPLALLELMGGGEELIKYIKQVPELILELGEINFEEILKEANNIKSQEDYRRFLKAHY